MKTLYLDIFSGISGDMFIGALIDLGVDAHKLGRELGMLQLAGYHLHVARQHKSAIEGVKFDVHLAHEQPHEHDHGHATDQPQHDEAGHSQSHDQGHSPAPHEQGDHHHDNQRNFAEIKQLIRRSKLSPWVKNKSIAVFQRIAEAEGIIHGHPAEKVHFHEVGAVDSIVDVVGAVVGLEMLGKPRVLAAPVVEGTGWVKCAHGQFPVPTPATLAILGARGIGITQCAEPHELVTPTGAALLAEFAEGFGPMSRLVAERIGFGLGTRDNKTRPNVLRAVLGKLETATTNRQRATAGAPGHDWETDRVAVLETNLDDISGEILGRFIEIALAAGALDIFHTPIQMKKNRPGVLLTLLCAEAEADKFCELILRETSAFGVRRTIAERRKLRREFATVKCKNGLVTVKLGKLNGKVVQAAPEFESCIKLAAQQKIPLRQVYAAAAEAFAKGRRGS